MGEVLTAGVAVAVAGSIVVVGVAAALALQPLQRGPDLLPVAPAARLAAAGFGAEQLRDPGGAILLEGRPLGAPAGPLTGWVPPARPVPPGLVPHLGLLAGGRLRGRPARPVGRGRRAVPSRPGPLAPPMLRRWLVVQAVGAPVAIQCHRRREPGPLLGGPLRPWHGTKRLHQPARLLERDRPRVDPLP